MTPEEVGAASVRGQYGPGALDGAARPRLPRGARRAADSATETFAALKLEVDNWRWAGVPFYLRTGKRLPERDDRDRHRVPPRAAPAAAGGASGSRPTGWSIHVQPDEGISLHFHAKCPGPQIRLAPVEMTFTYTDLEGDQRRTGYETLLYDCHDGRRDVFHRADMVEAAWRVVDPHPRALWARERPRRLPELRRRHLGTRRAPTSSSNATAALARALRDEHPRRRHRRHHTRLALFDDDGARLAAAPERSIRAASTRDLEEVVRALPRATPAVDRVAPPASASPGRCATAAASPTNLPWVVDAAELGRVLGARHLGHQRPRGHGLGHRRPACRRVRGARAGRPGRRRATPP